MTQNPNSQPAPASAAESSNSQPKRLTCRWCDRRITDDPGRYYHEKRCEASATHDALMALRAMNPEILRRHFVGIEQRLESALEMARYVGD